MALCRKLRHSRSDTANGQEYPVGAPHDHYTDEAARIRGRLALLSVERQSLEMRLSERETGDFSEPDADPGTATVTDRSPAPDKIALFRSFFRGRTDVYPKRWENARTSRAGYAPVCANEWKPRLCGKPRIRCGACPNQAFVPVTDEAIEAHLRRRGALGVYPLSPQWHSLSGNMSAVFRLARNVLNRWVIGSSPAVGKKMLVSLAPLWHCVLEPVGLQRWRWTHASRP